MHPNPTTKIPGLQDEFTSSDKVPFSGLPASLASLPFQIKRRGPAGRGKILGFGVW